MNMIKQNEFLAFQALGYTRLVPIIPPDAEVSANSSLNKRRDARGKAVGVRGWDGKWFGFDWLPHESDDADFSRWHDMGAGVGVKTGQHNGFTLIAIDADTLNPKWAKITRDIVSSHLGDNLPIRVGKYPKAAYICRVDGEYRYTRVEFGERNDKGSLQDRVEILSDGRQFVAHGIHPATNKPYTWPRPLTPFDTLPAFTPNQIDKLMAALQEALPAAAPLVREGATTEINQSALKGKLETVSKAVRTTPNTSALFPTREAYRDYGYAIKAALPDDQQAAFELYADWCDRWVEGENDPEIVEADWRRMKPPYRRGAGWLYELAEQHSNGTFTEAEAWFEDIDETIANNPFAEINLNAPEAKTDTYKLLTIDEIVNRPPPVWLIDRHIPQKSVGFLYSEPGAGKSFLALDIALSIAYGMPTWQGDAITAADGTSVIYIAAEGSYGFRNRIAAWRKARGLTENLSKRFFLIEQSINFMSDEDIKRLLRTLSGVTADGHRPSLVFVDTVSRALPGADENLQKDMTLFVKACDAVKDGYGCAVMGIHHAGKAGDMRGSTVLKGAGDFVFHLSRKKGATIGALECEKQKDGPDGWSDSYRFETVGLGEGETSLVVGRTEMGVGPSVALTPDISAAVLDAMRAAWDEGAPWSKAPQSKERYAVRRMIADFGFDGMKAEETLAIWEQTGLIRVATLSAKHRLTGYQVGEGAGHAVRNEGIFG